MASGHGGRAIIDPGGSAASGGTISVTEPSAGTAAIGRAGGPGVDGGTTDEGSGGTTANSVCSGGWGIPSSDPGYRGIRGTLDGQPLDIDGKDVSAAVAFCVQSGPEATPNLSVYFPLNGMSFWFYDSCSARVTSPEETSWHELEVHLSTDVAKVTVDPATGIDPAASHTVSGHVKLQGQSPQGLITLEADFYLDAGVRDLCAPRIG